MSTDSEVVIERTINNNYGLHARASGALAERLKRFETSVMVRQAGQRRGDLVDAKSILSLMTMGASRGSQLEFVVGQGPDTKQAADFIRELDFATLQAD